MTDCPRLGKLFGGCKFEARYDRIGPTNISGGRYETADTMAAILDAQKARDIYVQDTCIRCGKVVKR